MLLKIKKIKYYLKTLKNYPVDKNWLLGNRRQLEIFMSNNPIKLQRSTNYWFNKFNFMNILKTKYVAPVLAGIIILVLGGSAIASQNSLPNDNLYPIKIAIEKVELAIGSLTGNNKKAEIKLKHALKRLEEVQALIEEHQEDGIVVDAIENLEDQTEDALEETEETLEEENGEETLNKKVLLVQKLEQLTERHQEVLQRVYDKVPDQAKPAIERAIERTQKGHQQAIESIQKDKGKHKGWYKDEDEEGDEDECETSITCEEDQIASASGEIDDEGCELMICIPEEQTATESAQ